MKTLIKMYVKSIASGKTTFNVASAKVRGEYCTIKFGRTTGIELNKYKQGYYDVYFDTTEMNTGVRKYVKKNGDEGSESVFWINDSNVVIKDHLRTGEEQKDIDKLFDEISDNELPF